MLQAVHLVVKISGLQITAVWVQFYLFEGLEVGTADFGIVVELADFSLVVDGDVWAIYHNNISVFGACVGEGLPPSPSLKWYASQTSKGMQLLIPLPLEKFFNVFTKLGISLSVVQLIRTHTVTKNGIFRFKASRCQNIRNKLFYNSGLQNTRKIFVQRFLACWSLVVNKKFVFRYSNFTRF